MNKKELDKLTNKIIGIAIDIHKKIGPGFTEKVYQRILYLELQRLVYKFVRERKIAIKWNNKLIGYYIVDFIVENCLIIEIKAVSEIIPLHKAQLLSYLKASDKRLGLILNFGQTKLQIKRIVNRL